MATKVTQAKLTLAKSINAIVTKQDAFTKAVDALNSFKEETLNELALQIEAKQSELEELEKQFKVKQKDGEIEVSQRIKEFGYDEAVKIIQENGQIVVLEEEYEGLKNANQDLRLKLEADLDKIREEEKASHKRALSAALSNMELKHKAETAVLTATADQKEREVEHLNNTIISMKQEINEQRTLTKEVAMAGAKGAVTQTFGKA